MKTWFSLKIKLEKSEKSTIPATVISSVKRFVINLQEAGDDLGVYILALKIIQEKSKLQDQLIKGSCDFKGRSFSQ